MDKLKNFIDSNRGAFEDEPLPAGHFERFEKKLPPVRRGPARWIGIVAASAAAVITLLVFLKIQSETEGSKARQVATYVSETHEEIEELRVYYNMQMEELYTQIRRLYKTDQVPGGLELLKESKQVIKASAEFEDNILPNLPYSDAGLFAMNQHYNTSLQSLNIMLRQMEHVVDVNNNF